MPNVNPNAGTVAPGVVTDPNKYPQWGVGNTGGKWNVVQADNAGDKQADMKKGYLVWFGDKTDADNFAQDQTGFASGNAPAPLSGLAAIGDFFSKLGQASTWIRVAEVLLGAGLIIVALAKIASDTPIGKAAVKAGKAAAIL